MRLKSKLLKKSAGLQSARRIIELSNQYSPGSVSPEELKQPLKDFPFQGGKVFRGYVFKSKDFHDVFMKETYKGNVFKTFGVWFKTKDAAVQEVQKNSTSDRETWDWIKEFKAVVVELDVPAGEGVDVDSAMSFVVDSGHTLNDYYNPKNNVVFLPLNLYEIVTEDQKAYKEQIDSSNADQVLLDSIGGTPDLQKLRYILHNINTISDASRDKAFNLLYKRVKISSYFHPENKWGSEYFEASTDSTSETWMMFTYWDVWTSRAQRKLLSDFRLELRKLDTEIKKALWEHLDMSRKEIRLAPEIQWMQAMSGYQLGFTKNYGKQYQDLGDEVFDINKIRDPKEKMRAIQEHSDRVVTLLNNLLRTTPNRKLRD